VTEATEPLLDVAAALFPSLEVCDLEELECGDSLLLELDPTFQSIEVEQ
jgi:hypothetical protein